MIEVLLRFSLSNRESNNFSHITMYIISWPTVWGPAIVMVTLSVHLCVCHMQVSMKLSKINVWLLGNSNRNPGFPIQNLPSDL